MIGGTIKENAILSNGNGSLVYISHNGLSTMKECAFVDKVSNDVYLLSGKTINPDFYLL